MIPDEQIERIRESADIVGVIGDYVELKRTGTDYRGPCPFHQGTNRNFSVSPKKNAPMKPTASTPMITSSRR